MEEADTLCERIAIIDHGKVLALGAPAELKQHARCRHDDHARPSKATPPSSSGAPREIEGVRKRRARRLTSLRVLADELGGVLAELVRGAARVGPEGQ